MNIPFFWPNPTYWSAGPKLYHSGPGWTDSHFKQFSGLIESNWAWMIATALEFWPLAYVSFIAAPMRKSFLKAALRVVWAFTLVSAASAIMVIMETAFIFIEFQKAGMREAIFPQR